MRTDTLTVGGLPGTGTSTLCRILRDRLGLPYTYAGQIFRDEAAKRSMDLHSFGLLCEQDPEIDRAIDDEQVRLLQEGHVILEGRLAGWLAHRQNVPALKVWVVCERPERLRRVLERDGEAGQREKTLAREASEAARYREYYDIDLADQSPYDLVLDSTHRSPEDLANEVVAALGPRTV